MAVIVCDVDAVDAIDIWTDVVYTWPLCRPREGNKSKGHQWRHNWLFFIFLFLGQSNPVKGLDAINRIIATNVLLFVLLLCFVFVVKIRRIAGFLLERENVICYCCCCCSKCCVCLSVCQLALTSLLLV